MLRKLWGGAFAEGSNDLVDAFGQSIESDLRFWQEDVIGSIAHAKMLGETGIISGEESSLLVEGLRQILKEGEGSLPRDVEDIHTAVETRLGEIVGPAAGKLHTARSRNDQVATDARLWFMTELRLHMTAIKQLQEVLVRISAQHRQTMMPGWTHQQPAQPTTLGFHLMAHYWALQRHGWRAERLVELANVSPLGACALAGTSFPIDRHLTASELGFAGPIPNALDATSDRSWVLDALNWCAGLMVDLSRMSQELVLWSTREFGYVRLSDNVTTGSSIMPQKRNPDMAELIRGRTGRAIGNATGFMATMKALPLGYNRDTQDDKPALFDSMDLCYNSLGLVALMYEGAKWNTRELSQSAGEGFSTATELANFLATNGMTFREAHEVVGQITKTCSERGWKLHQLTGSRLIEIAPQIPRQALNVLNPKGCVQRHESFGGPGPKAMSVQIRRAKTLLSRNGFKEFI